MTAADDGGTYECVVAAGRVVRRDGCLVKLTFVARPPEPEPLQDLKLVGRPSKPGGGA